jgi:NAD(P)-dependent dehydrogenase (short-subunit alcohol dehydrogenase family)
MIGGSIRNQRVRGNPGSKAIIVGGASGMALATAEAFVAKGGKVAILDLEKSKGAEVAARLKGTFHPCNVMDYEGTEKVMGEAVKAMGGLHFVVNTPAGIASARLRKTARWSARRLPPHHRSESDRFIQHQSHWREAHERK